MMGSKQRDFLPLVHVSLDHLVPANHFYRRLDRILDLSFVRDLVAERYARGDRPSVDPVVFFKLQLVMLFEGIRSERHSSRSPQTASACVAGALRVVWGTPSPSRCPIIPASRASAIALASTSFAASLMRSWPGVSR